MGKREKKYQSLRKIYYRSFFILIVIPILFVFCIAVMTVNVMIKNAEISNIQSAQESVRDLLEKDVEDASLQLSHLVHIDNGNFLSMAAETDRAPASEKNAKIVELEDLFRIAVTPKQDIISMHIYMKDGKSVSLKDELLLPDEEIKESDWYRQAKDKQNMVSIGTYDTGSTPLTSSKQRKWEFIITAALSPDRTLERSGRLETVALFYKSRIRDIITKYEKNPVIGTTLILDQDNRIIYKGRAGDSGDWYMQYCDADKTGVFQKKAEIYESRQKEEYTFVISEMPSTGWKVVNFVPTRNLTERFYRIVYIMLFVLVLLFLFFYVFSWYFLKNILMPVHHVVGGMKELQENNLEVRLEPEGQYEIREMIYSFNQTVHMLKISKEKREQAQRKKHEAEIRALQSQINPHFLVNTLNTIRFMAQIARYDGIRKMADALIRILSCSFRSNTSFYTLKEELEVLDSYLYLMEIRYSEGFKVEYEIDEECRVCLMPRLILQPLVENSIVHGFTDEEIGHLKISAGKENDMLCIKIWDDGIGMTEEKINQVLGARERKPDDNMSIGIENVVTRLKLNFGEKCGFDIQSEPGEYTEIILRLPVWEEKHEESADC